MLKYAAAVKQLGSPALMLSSRRLISSSSSSKPPTGNEKQTAEPAPADDFKIKLEDGKVWTKSGEADEQLLGSVPFAKKYESLQGTKMGANVSQGLKSADLHAKQGDTWFYGFFNRIGTFVKGGQGKAVRNNTVAELSAGTRILKRMDAHIKENKLGMWYYIPLPDVHLDDIAFDVKGVMLRVFDRKSDEDIAEVQLPNLGRKYTKDDLKINLERRELVSLVVVNVPDYIDKLLPVNWDKDAVEDDEPDTTGPVGKKD